VTAATTAAPTTAAATSPAVTTAAPDSTAAPTAPPTGNIAVIGVKKKLEKIIKTWENV